MLIKLNTFDADIRLAGFVDDVMFLYQYHRANESKSNATFYVELDVRQLQCSVEFIRMRQQG